MKIIDKIARSVTGNDCIGCEYRDQNIINQSLATPEAGRYAAAIKATVDNCVISNINMSRTAEERQANCEQRFLANFSIKNTVSTEAVANDYAQTAEEPFTNFISIW